MSGRCRVFVDGRPHVAARPTPLKRGEAWPQDMPGGSFTGQHPGEKPSVSSADSPLFKGAFFARRGGYKG